MQCGWLLLRSAKLLPCHSSKQLTKCNFATRPPHWLLLSPSLSSPSLSFCSSPRPSSLRPFCSFSSPSAASSGLISLALGTQIRPELLRDDTVYVTESAMSSIDFARAVAAAKSKKGDDNHFMIVSLDELYERHLLWRRELPDVQPFYAVKCNSDPVLLRMLGALGCSFDCASQSEIEKVLSLGFSPGRVIFSHPCKAREEIAHAKKAAVSLMTFDSKEEIDKVTEYGAVNNSKLLLRISVPDAASRFPADTNLAQSQKKRRQSSFGRRQGAASISAAFGLFVGKRRAKEDFHVGSNCRDASAYIKAIEYSRELFDLAASLGMKMDILDIGGGFPGDKQHKPTFEEIASLLRSSLSAHFPSSSGIRLIAEPGRFFACRPFTLVANVTSVTETNAARLTENDADAEQKAFMYYVNDGCYCSFRNVVYEDTLINGRPLFEKTGVSKEEFLSTVWGPTCDCIDAIEEKKFLPRLSVGDWLLWPEMGAYTLELATSFNGFHSPELVHFASKDTWRDL